MKWKGTEWERKTKDERFQKVIDIERTYTTIPLPPHPPHRWLQYAMWKYIYVHHSVIHYSVVHYSVLHCTAPMTLFYIFGRNINDSHYYYYSVVHYSAVHYSAVHYTVMYSAVLYTTVLYTTVLYTTVLYTTALYTTVLYTTVLYTTVFYTSALYTTALYTTALYTTALYTTVLYSYLPEYVQRVRTASVCDSTVVEHFLFWTDWTLIGQAETNKHSDWTSWNKQTPWLDKLK